MLFPGNYITPSHEYIFLEKFERQHGIFFPSHHKPCEAKAKALKSAPAMLGTLTGRKNIIITQMLQKMELPLTFYHSKLCVLQLNQGIKGEKGSDVSVITYDSKPC